MKPGRKPRFTSDDIALAMELRTEGCSWENIAIGLGAFSAEGLRSAVKIAKQRGMGMTRDEYRVRAREFAARGERVGVSKLNPDKVRWIRENRRGLSLKAMAKELGVHYRTVEKVHYGETWGHV